MDGGFGDNVCVEAVAKVDGVDIITFKGIISLSCPLEYGSIDSKQRDTCAIAIAESTARIGENSPFQVAVHNRKEDLQEQVDGINQYRQQVEPRFARHGDKVEYSIRRPRRCWRR
jgi:hypothetical protein